MKAWVSHFIFAVSLVSVTSASANRQESEPIQPIKPAEITDPAKVSLGKKLFFDPRLSRSATISCNSCHNLATAGVDNLPASVGFKWQVGDTNSPTVLNASLHSSQFWDGRVETLKEQAKGPIENPVEMGSNHELAVQTIASIPEYQAEFRAVFGGPGVDIERIADAIATFEETLVTPNSRFDRWLAGDDGAITSQELNGYELFKSKGCIGCHSGPAVGGNVFQKMGLLKPYPTKTKNLGRYNVTKKEHDKYVYKVPSLRNVELTYPYLHDGSIHTLEEVVKIMGEYQIAQDLSEADVNDIVAFLRTLTGQMPRIVLPHLPASRPDTPRPDLGL